MKKLLAASLLSTLTLSAFALTSQVTPQSIEDAAKEQAAVEVEVKANQIKPEAPKAAAAEKLQKKTASKLHHKAAKKAVVAN
ncbi:hypothetical protein ICN48_06845 [Polynucleobacter sp. JS-Safj-400b-B2]|uniref:hypothetical protein n=1 Tax=Polynucleobacter sp. JS-Safj-400b-B2 TaxID=2576921 RepID=UPI001C0B1843|nr:hypothetical protein [Polynucleobacter sp. JS-Safj-400b-B2]MBU3625950.1 hypothetical protein [Polynucleobacter sp. JS-Safj-400b-B2]